MTEWLTEPAKVERWEYYGLWIILILDVLEGAY